MYVKAILKKSTRLNTLQHYFYEEGNKGHLFWEFFVEPRHRDDSRIFSSDVTRMSGIENEQLSYIAAELLELDLVSQPLFSTPYSISLFFILSGC